MHRGRPGFGSKDILLLYVRAQTLRHSGDSSPGSARAERDVARCVCTESHGPRRRPPRSLWRAGACHAAALSGQPLSGCRQREAAAAPSARHAAGPTPLRPATEGAGRGLVARELSGRIPRGTRSISNPNCCWCRRDGRQSLVRLAGIPVYALSRRPFFCRTANTASRVEKEFV